MLKIVFLCGVKGRLLLLPTELALPWQQLCWWFLTQRIHLLNFLLVFLLPLQCNLEDKIGFYVHWNRRNGVKFESPIFIPAPQMKPRSITFTDIKMPSSKQRGRRSSRAAEMFHTNLASLLYQLKNRCYFPDLNFSSLQKKSKYKGVFPRAGLSLVKKSSISTLCHKQLSSFCVLTFSWRSAGLGRGN